MTTLTPFVLQHTPALIESVFPAQKVSFESQRERKAGAGQTLTALGSYWKGRKPLILVRAIVLGSLLPPTGDAEKDLEIYEQLLAFDKGGLARRALANNAFKPKEIAQTLILTNPWHYFAYTLKDSSLIVEEVESWQTPFDSDERGLTLRWQRDLSETDKLDLYLQMLHTLPNYEARAALCKRPEELDQTELFAPVWAAVNAHYQHLGMNAHSHQELVEQLGMMRFGHRPKVGDTFCGGGSIPFEAARLGCDVYASDLNPIACMLTWGALNIIGAQPEQRAEIEEAQREVAAEVDAEITKLGIEHDSHGNRAKAFLYCLEVRCPETGWLVPMAPSWVISKSRNIYAKLIPNHSKKLFTIEITGEASREEMIEADKGTVINGNLVYKINGKTYSVPISTLRGDYKDVEGNNRNRLRLWEKEDFKPRQDDIFQERLYCIQWIQAETLYTYRPITYFASVTEEDLAREKQAETIVAENLAKWQADGLVPDMAIESGDKTDEPIRTRGWSYWHHLFTPIQLIQLALFKKQINLIDHPEWVFYKIANTVNWISKLCLWATSLARPTGGAGDYSVHVFYNQALNTHLNYASRSWFDYLPIYNKSSVGAEPLPSNISHQVIPISANAITQSQDIFITDPPYADAVHYHEITEYFIAWLRKNPPSPFKMGLGFTPRLSHQRQRRRLPARHGRGLHRYDATHARQRHAMCNVYPSGHRRVVGYGRYFLGRRFAGRRCVVYRHRNHLGTEKRRLCARHGNSDAAQTSGWR